MDRSLIDQYEGAGEKLRQAIKGLGREGLVAFPVPGTWSIQQIVIHIMDSDLIGADRMKRIIAEENPTLVGYDQDKFVANLFYDEQSAAEAVEIFDRNRRLFARVLRKLPESVFARKGTHTERGVVTLEQQLSGYVQHFEHHLKFIVDKRKKMGK